MHAKLPRAAPRLDRPWPTEGQFTGRYARSMRLAFGIHHTYFGPHANVSPDTLIRWERGQWKPTDDEWVRRVREALRRMVRAKLLTLLGSLDAAADPEIYPATKARHAHQRRRRSFD